MRKILALTTFAFALSLAACDSSSSSPTGSNNSDSTSRTGSLIGTWKATTTNGSTTASLVVTEILTLSGDGSFRLIYDFVYPSTVSGSPGLESADTGIGKWHASSTKLFLAFSTNSTDSVSYTLSGSSLTIVLPSLGMALASDTGKFTKQ